jgi:hypothetical protein
MFCIVVTELLQFMQNTNITSYTHCWLPRKQIICSVAANNNFVLRMRGWGLLSFHWAGHFCANSLPFVHTFKQCYFSKKEKVSERIE